MQEERTEQQKDQVRQFLDTWDPYGLIAGGAPADQFGPYAQGIYEALASGELKTEAALATHIASLFSRWFEPIFTPENCSEITHTIWTWWEHSQ